MVHDSAATGYQRASATYTAGRPSYHPKVLDEIAASIGDSGQVIDLGAGTGIATAALLDRGLDVLAVEPVDAMRATLTQHLPAVRVAAGTAESIPAEDNSVAAVMVAQAFHWFDHRPALDEIARVLASDGQLITLWNVRDESVPWMAAYTAIQDRVQGTTPRYRDMVWRTAIEHDRRFQLVAEPRVPNPQPSDPDHTISRFLSTSFIASLDELHQRELEQEVRGLVADFGDSYDFPYSTEAQIWSLTAT